MDKKITQHSYSLAHALFGLSMWPYIWYRTRLFFINSFLKIVLHIAEFYFIFLFFSPNLFHRLIIFRSITFILYGAWWGALEILREYGRGAKQCRQLHTVKTEVIYWLFLTLALLFIIDVITVFLLHPSLKHQQASDMISFYFYLFAILVQINLAFLANVLHSGIYGISRVYRPLFSLVLPSAASFFIMFGGWFMIGIYALPCAFIVSAFLGLYFSFHYTLSMYKMLNLNQQSHCNWNGFRQFLYRTLNKEFFLASLAGLFMTATGPLIIIFTLFFRLQDWDYLTFLYLYMIIPILQLNVEWIFLFYFDLKRLLYKPYFLLLQRYHHYVYGFAILITLFAWILSGLACLFYVGHWWISVWVLLPWFGLRSFLSYLQIRAFVKRLYVDVIISGMVVVLSLVPFLNPRMSFVYSLVGIFIAFCIGLIWLRRRRFYSHQPVLTTHIIQPYFFWLHRAHTRKKSLVFCQIELAYGVRYSQVITIIQNINQASKKPFLFTLVNQHCLLGYQILRASSQIDNTLAIVAGAGLTEKVVMKMANIKSLNQDIMTITGVAEPISMKEVAAKFKQLFPEAIVCFLIEKKYLLPDDLSSQVLTGLRNFLERPWSVNPYGKLSVSALLEEGVATALFIIDLKKAEVDKVRAWLEWLMPINNT